MRLVRIDWVDSIGAGASWGEMDNIVEPEEFIISSVGWLAIDGERYKVIVPHQHPKSESLDVEAHGCGDMSIPTCCVKKITDLK